MYLIYLTCLVFQVSLLIGKQIVFILVMFLNRFCRNIRMIFIRMYLEYNFKITLKMLFLFIFPLFLSCFATLFLVSTEKRGNFRRLTPSLNNYSSVRNKRRTPNPFANVQKFFTTKWSSFVRKSVINFQVMILYLDCVVRITSHVQTLFLDLVSILYGVQFQSSPQNLCLLRPPFIRHLRVETFHVENVIRRIFHIAHCTYFIPNVYKGYICMYLHNTFYITSLCNIQMNWIHHTLYLCNLDFLFTQQGSW